MHPPDVPSRTGADARTSPPMCTSPLTDDALDAGKHRKGQRGQRTQRLAEYSPHPSAGATSAADDELGSSEAGGGGAAARHDG